MHSRLTSGLLCALALAAALPAAKCAEEVTAPPPPSRVNALLNFEFSDKYLTPRGMIVHDEGLTFQPLVLGFFNLYKGESFIKDFTFVGGVWNDFSSKGVSKQPPFGSKPNFLAASPFCRGTRRPPTFLSGCENKASASAAWTSRWPASPLGTTPSC